jgi:hypothetical protein
MGLIGNSLSREGSWWVASKSDPRWDCEGRGFVGGLMCPGAALEEVKKIQERLGEEPPDDLEFGYMKD